MTRSLWKQIFVLCDEMPILENAGFGKSSRFSSLFWCSRKNHASEPVAHFRPFALLKNYQKISIAYAVAHFMRKPVVSC